MKQYIKKLLVIPIVLVILSMASLLIYRKSCSITLNAKEVKMNIGELYSLKVKKKGDYTYKSINEEVATIDEEGNILAKKEGETVIRVKSSKGYWADCKIVVESFENEIKFKSDTIELEKGDKTKLLYDVPDGYEVRTEKWVSTDNDIISVKDGEIKAEKVGDATIMLTINDLVNIECYVKSDIYIDDLNIKKSSITIYQGDILALDYSVSPKNTTEKELEWKSEDDKIVVVDKYGNITGKEKGETKVTVKTKKGKKDSINIKVKEMTVKSVSIDKSSVNLYKDEKITLKATVKPLNASDQTINWSSSDESIATVDKSGNVVAKKIGKAKITAKSSNGKKASTTINVRNNAYNKDVIFFGDSITYGLKGTPVGYGWPDYIRDNFEIGKTINEGHSGWFISNKFNERWINTIVEKYKNEKFDYVILHGGTNDISKGVELGKFDSNDFSGKYDINTFLGGLETYIYTVKKQFPNAKIGYIINYETPNNNDNRKNLSANYYTEMKKVLEKWKIPYLDLYFGSAPNGEKYGDILKVNTNDYLVDTLHLNKAGYKVISPYIYNWMNTL